MTPNRNSEERPLLSSDSDDGYGYGSGTGSRDSDESATEIKFTEHDETNPRNWPTKDKVTNVVLIALMAILSPLGSSMFAPGISQIAEDLETSQEAVIATSAGYVIMQGLGPLILAPFSEMFGRRIIYIVCFSMFGLLQIPTALSPNITSLIVVRCFAGFFGSVGIAIGGGSISDLYAPRERAKIFGWYLLGPLLGPTLGPLLGGIIVTRLGWRSVYWALTILSTSNTVAGYFFLRETYAPTILAEKKDHQLRKDKHKDNVSQSSDQYYFEGEDRRTMSAKLNQSIRRPFKILITPIVFIMAVYQAIIYGTTYSIYTNLQNIFSGSPYNMTSEQVGLLFLGPGLGFLTALAFLVPRIDSIFNKLTKNNDGQEMPEFRLPLANLGSVLIPVSLLWFAWTADTRQHWFLVISSTFFYGIGQEVIFNTVQNYYIDAFEQYAASAIAAGSVFRSLVGGVVPLIAPMLFDKVGYGWGISLFALCSLLVAPSPILFFYYGRKLRERYPLDW